MLQSQNHKQLVESLADLAPEEIRDVVQRACAKARQHQALTIFPVEIDTKVSMAGRIIAADFSNVDRLIPQEDKVNHVGGPEDLVLLSFGVDVTSEEVVNGITKLKLHPANLNELVAFATAYQPQTDRRVPYKPIAGVGVNWLLESGIIQPCLYPDGDRWQLMARREHYSERAARWSGEFYFLAQRCCRRHKTC